LKKASIEVLPFPLAHYFNRSAGSPGKHSRSKCRAGIGSPRRRNCAILHRETVTAPRRFVP
jgi:hypothetical protein